MRIALRPSLFPHTNPPHALELRGVGRTGCRAARGGLRAAPAPRPPPCWPTRAGFAPAALRRRRRRRRSEKTAAGWGGRGGLAMQGELLARRGPRALDTMRAVLGGRAARHSGRARGGGGVGYPANFARGANSETVVGRANCTWSVGSSGDVSCVRAFMTPTHTPAAAGGDGVPGPHAN